MKKILLVEDESHVVSFIRKGLGEEGYEVSVAMDGDTGLRMVRNGRFDLVILDIMLPDMNGLEVCKLIRQHDGVTPILFLTALGTAENVAVGLDSGADDYLVKPFKFIELVARIRTLLRRAERSAEPAAQTGDQHVLRAGDLELDDDAKIVRRGGDEISLTATEFRLLHFLLRNKNKVMSRMDILEDVWGIDFNMGTNVVDVYVNYLRKKMDNGHGEKLIHTVIGMGYALRDPERTV
ncbi:MAG: response regulator transcription factor [Flavobacteriales bacterium]|nr:response regulator transcription factor [Flavobacteriales bacterium]